MTMLSIAVLAAFGIKVLLASRRPWIAGAAAVAFPLVALAEYASIPIPLVSVPVGEELPAVYRWLADQDDNGPILELPLPSRQQRKNGDPEIFRVYCSILHWRPMVNGYSGFHPPVYREMRRRWEHLPPRQTVIDAQRLGVRNVILHTDQFEDGEKLVQVRAGLAATEPAGRLIHREGPAEVWELPAPSREPGIRSPGAGRFILRREGWAATAGVNPRRARRAIDGEIKTWWNGGPLRTGDWFMLDLGSIHPLHGIVLHLKKHHLNFPQGFILDVSTDGNSWQVVREEELAALPITAYLRPTDFSFSIFFEPTVGRYLRIMNTVADDSHNWSIHEIDVW